MNTKCLAKHFDMLTPEERFRLIVAAEPGATTPNRHG